MLIDLEADSGEIDEAEHHAQEAVDLFAESGARSLQAQGVEPEVASLFDDEALHKAVVDHDAVLFLAVGFL